jgi:Protein of unknown function (DUF3568)
MTGLRKWLSRLALPALALAALGNGGCLLFAAGAAGAAGVSYVYYNGLLYRDYHANMADSLAAVRTSLTDLQFPILEQKADTGTAYVKTRTADGHSVRIHLDVVPSPIPAEGSLTRVGIRVGFSGDEAVSARILEQINLHLAPPGTATPTPAGPASLLAPQPLSQEKSSGVRQAIYETNPPPLAGLVAPTAPAAPKR